ncbi:hypothetical protein [Nocardioides conyzicola]|uniref:Uncharacterized protein n=1 Tax=Nocardioides conyzicola TaxID=1651781 RepID=A0ABP8X7F9_9ACTN
MSEQQIKDGYDRLEGALAPPLDSLQRVDRRVAARRRQRRTAVAGVATLGVLAVGGTVVVLASGDDGTGPAVANDTAGDPVSTLVLRRPDGSTYAFDDVKVSCTRPRTAAGDPISEAKGRIWMYSPIEFTGSEKGGDAQVTQPFVYFEGVVAKLHPDQTFSLPVDGPGDSDTFPMTFFVADTEGAPDGNEVSSAVSDATGTVRVLRASCDPVPVLQLDVTSTLGSEEEKTSLDVAGTLR